MRTLDVTHLNDVANRPHVRPFMGGEGQIDMSVLVADVENNYAFSCATGGFMVVRLMGGRYECHTIADSALPIRPLIRLVRLAMQYMFTETDCEELVTKCPPENHGAEHLSRMCGFQDMFTMEGTHYRNLTLDKWVPTCSPVLRTGRDFHETLEAAKRESGSQLVIHEDDEIHDYFVGAAVEMIKAGNTEKGLRVYNLWAALTGYLPARLLSLHPPVVDIGDAILTLAQGNIKVLTCR